MLVARVSSSTRSFVPTVPYAQRLFELHEPPRHFQSELKKQNHNADKTLLYGTSRLRSSYTVARDGTARLYVVHIAYCRHFDSYCSRMRRVQVVFIIYTSYYTKSITRLDNMLRLALSAFFLAAASAGTPDNVSSRLMVHVSFEC